MLALGSGVSVLIDRTVIRLIVVAAPMFCWAAKIRGSRHGWTGRCRTGTRGPPRPVMITDAVPCR